MIDINWIGSFSTYFRASLVLKVELFVTVAN